MRGLPDGPVVTDQDGYYSVKVPFDWSGEVTPTKKGYTFEPATRTYSNVRSDQTSQDYIAKVLTFTISGTTGAKGVLLNGLPENPISDANGAYSATVRFDFSGEVRPTKEGYTFEPGSRTYSNVTQDMTDQNYTAMPITYTISGTTGVGGVELQGLPGNPVSNEAGTYSVEVPYAWSGTVTPTKQGYVFTPSSRQYDDLSSGETDQNYQAALQTFIISGNAGVGGVVMEGLPKRPVTAKDGSYTDTVDYGWSGRVKPIKEGYTFSPTERSYDHVIANELNQDYTANPITFKISGNAGLPGVELKGLPNNPVSGSGGVYTATIPYGWDGTVTPTKEGYEFEPASRTYSKVTADRDNQDYTSSLIKVVISGSTGVPGVVLDGFPNNPVSDKDGRYSVTVDYNWSGTVMPMKQGYTFTPQSRQYSQVTADESNQDYTAALQKRTISGVVSAKEGPLQGVKLSAAGTEVTATTDANGEYKLEVDYGWSGSVTPSKKGYTFDPGQRDFEVIAHDRTNQGYTAELIKVVIADTIRVGGIPLEGVQVTADNGGGSTVTDAEGKFSVKVPYGWSGKVTPQKEGFKFTPASRPLSNVTEDVDLAGKPLRPKVTAPPEPKVTTPPEPKVTTPPEPKVTTPPEPKVTTPPQPEPSPGPEQYTTEKQRLQQEVDKLREKLDLLLAQQQGEGPQAPTVGPFDPNALKQEATALRPRPQIPQEPPTYVGPRGQEPSPTNPLINAVFVDTDLRKALQQIAAQAKVDIYTDGTVEGKVTCRLRNMPLDKALQIVLKDTGYAIKEIPNSYLVYTPISNVFLDTPLREALQTIATQAGVTIIPDATVTGTVTAELQEVPLESALEMVLAGSGYVVSNKDNYYLVSSANPEDPQFRDASITRRVKLNYMAADTALSLLNTAFRQYVQAETTTHTVAITAPPSIVERITKDLKAMDIPARHVMLDARLVVMERGNLINLGIEWGWPTMRLGTFSDYTRHGLGADDKDPPASQAAWPWGVQIGYTPDSVFTDSLMLTLNLLEENGEADIIANPQVLAQDGRQALIQVMNEEYFMMTVPESFGGFYSRAELEKVESGTRLTITPRITDNDEITLDVAVEVSDSIPRGRGSDLPVVTRRTANNTVTVKDGGTVALAGLTENRSRKKEKRVPGLSSLPVLGNLFKNSEDDKSIREVAVFITAHLIPESEQLIELGKPSARTQQHTMPTMPQTGQLQGSQFERNLREDVSRSLGRSRMQQPAEDQFEGRLRESLSQSMGRSRVQQPAEDQFERRLRESLAASQRSTR
jgi:type IV pilus assembly protein PilQ